MDSSPYKDKRELLHKAGDATFPSKPCVQMPVVEVGEGKIKCEIKPTKDELRQGVRKEFQMEDLIEEVVKEMHFSECQQLIK